VKILDNLGRLLLVIIAILVVTGGFDLRISDGRIEFSQVSLFGLALTLIGLILYKKSHLETSKLYQFSERFIHWCKSLSSKQILLIIFAAFGWLFITRLIRHYTLNTDLMDVSCVHQALFYPFTPVLLHCDACRNGTQMAEHIAWIFVVISPLFTFLKSDIAVFLFKYLAVGGGVVWFLKRGPLSNRRDVWLIAFLLLFASKTFRASLVWDFREDDLAFVFLLVSCVGIYYSRLRLYWTGFVLALICKENMAFVTLFFAPIFWLNRDSVLSRQRRIFHGVLTVVLSVIYALLVIKVFTPYFLKGAENLNNIVLRFPGLGSTLEEVLISLATSPTKLFQFVFGNVVTWSSFKYLVLLIAPFIVIGMSGWPWLIGAAPGVLMNCLQAFGNQRMMIFHYDLIVLPFLFMALAVGFRHLDLNLKRHRLKLLLALGVGLSVFDRSPSAEIRERLLTHGYRIGPTIQLSSLDLPGNVAADSKIWAHLNHLPNLRLINFPVGPLPTDSNEIRRQLVQANPIRDTKDQGRDPFDAQYVVLNLEDPWQNFLASELLSARGHLTKDIPESKTLFRVIELTQSLFSDYCDVYSICRIR